jgi:hypothetical protein
LQTKNKIIQELVCLTRIPSKFWIKITVTNLIEILKKEQEDFPRKQEILQKLKSQYKFESEIEIWTLEKLENFLTEIENVNKYNPLTLKGTKLCQPTMESISCASRDIGM